MSVIKYKDSKGHIHVLEAVKGDKGPVGPRGPVGPQGPTGPQGIKGGTLVKGVVPDIVYLRTSQLIYKTDIGDGYITEDTGELWVKTELLDDDNNPSGEFVWTKVPGFIPVKLDDLADVLIKDEINGGDILMFDSENMVWTNKPFVSGDGGSAALSKDIVVSLRDDKYLGALKNGSLIKAGTTFDEFVKQLAVETIRPTYTAPKVSINSDIIEAEIGKYVAPLLTFEYNQGDAGSLVKMELYKNDEKIYEDEAIFNEYKLSLHELNNSDVYKVKIIYNEGFVKVDSNGQPYPIGHIKAGSVEASITIKALWPYWSLAISSGEAPNAEYVRRFNPSGLDFGAKKEMLALSQEDSKTIIFAYPKELGECSQIEYVGFDTHNEDVFTKLIVEMPDMNLNYYKDYYLYYYTAPVFIGNARFILKL